MRPSEPGCVCSVPCPLCPRPRYSFYWTKEYHHILDFVEAVSQFLVYWALQFNDFTVGINVSICRLIPKLYVTFETWRSIFWIGLANTQSHSTIKRNLEKTQRKIIPIDLVSFTITKCQQFWISRVKLSKYSILLIFSLKVLLFIRIVVKGEK